jgi:hypothetical protein
MSAVVPGTIPYVVREASLAPGTTSRYQVVYTVLKALHFPVHTGTIYVHCTYGTCMNAICMSNRDMYV